MGAAPAYSPQKIHIAGGWFPLPNAVADKLPFLVDAEKAYVLLAYRYSEDGIPARVTDEAWVGVGRMTPQSRRNAEAGLEQKQWFDPKSRRLKPTPSGFLGWARHADPAKTRTAGRGESKPIPVSSRWVSQTDVDALVAAKVKEAPKMHPECESGCAMASGRASLVSVAYEEKAKPVWPSVQGDVPLRGADAARNPGVGTAHSGGTGGSADGPTLDSDPEVKWAKTLAVMRSELVDAGLALLLRILAVIVSFGTVSDGVLAQAIRIAVRKRGRAIDSIGSILLVNLVPEVLAAMRHQGRKLDADPVEHAPPWTEERAAELQAGLDEMEDAGRKAREKVAGEVAAAEAKRVKFTEDKRRARRIIAECEDGRRKWEDEEVEWARDFLWRARIVGGSS